MLLHVTILIEDDFMDSVNLRVQRHRHNLRALGLRPIQLWVPDTRQKEFIEECKRQSMLIQNDSDEHETLDWISSVTDDKGWV